MRRLAHIQTLTRIGNNLRNCSVCTCENLMSNNFRKTVVLKKYELQTKATRWGPLPCPNFSRRLDFPYICLQFFQGNFSRQEETFLQTNVMLQTNVLNILKRGSIAHVAASNTLNFFSVESLRVKL